MNRKTILSGAIVLYFIIGFEILIMISPFAGLFYTAFTPFLLQLANYPATKWLSAFFLPHMAVPPDVFLKFVRVTGSVLFLGGLAVFFICAIQVYTNKFLKRGTALKGLYSIIRHPQYVGLALAGIGLSILWPRFLTVALWLIMIGLYYLLSKDEERRMLKAYPDTYRSYMSRTGMFLPKKIERPLSPGGLFGKIGLYIFIVAFTLGTVFFLRDYTVKHLALWNESSSMGGPQVVALALMPDDARIMEHRMNDTLAMEGVRSKLKENSKYLVYFIPTDYIMQGLIADTGDEWRLYHRHFTLSRFLDWVLHPFSHLSGHYHHMDAQGRMHAANNAQMGVVRRLIFIRISDGALRRPTDFFAINAVRTPEFMVDIDVHNLKLLQIKGLSSETGWGKLPTPTF
jgi:protein-S-isoprenylcysteine O-methyltransferase Ste14